MPSRRIVIIGETGAGKSSLGNTIFKNIKFKVKHDLDTGMSGCEANTKYLSGREITLIDIPVIFDQEKELKPGLVKYVTECSPGAHAFIIVLKTEKDTEKGKYIISKINEYFSEEVFRYATVVFTHGKRLPKRQQIKDFVKTEKSLSDFVEKCGNRCHVVDNKHWSGRAKRGYRSNRYQVKKLLKSIEKTVKGNDGSYYTNSTLQEIERMIQQEEEHIAESSRNIPEEKIRDIAKEKVYNDVLNKVAGVAVGALLGAIFGVAAVSVVALLTSTVRDFTAKCFSAARVLQALSDAVQGQKPALDTAVKGAPDTAAVAEKDTDTFAAATATAKPLGEKKIATAEAGKAEEETGAIVARAIGKAAARVEAGAQVVIGTAAGAMFGGLTGYKAAETAETPWEAADKAAQAVCSSGLNAIETSQNLMSDLVKAVLKPLKNDS